MAQMAGVGQDQASVISRESGVFGPAETCALDLDTLLNFPQQGAIV